MKSYIRQYSVLMCVCELLLACGLKTAVGAEYTWVSGTNGNWTDAANWGGTVPGAGDIANILNGTVAADNACLQSKQITINLGGGATGQTAVLNTLDIAALTYVKPGGSLAIDGNHCQLGQVFIQGGAYASTANHYVKGATLTLDSGSYTSQNLNLGHGIAGVFTQNSGTATVTALASIGFNTTGTYTLNDGSATFGAFKVGVGGGGDFIQEGGTAAVTGQASIGDGATGTYTLKDGSATFGAFKVGVGGGGDFIQEGGTAAVTGQASIGDGATGTYTLKDGSATFEAFKVGAGGVGSFTQNGGTSTFNNVNTAISSGNDGTFTVTDGTANFIKNLSIGAASGKTGTLDLQGGTTHFTMRQLKSDGKTYDYYSASIGSASGATGVLKISGTAAVDFSGNDVHVGSNGTGRIEQSGGTFTFSRGWLNIGERSSGTYLLTGGELNTTKASMAVGRRYDGTMEISGTGVLNAGTLYVSMFPQKAGNSQLTLKSGGTANIATFFIGGENNYAESGTNPGTGTVLVEGGTLNVSGWTYVGVHSKDTVSSGGTGVLTLKGGNTTMNRLVVGCQGAGGNGTANFEGGTNNLTVVRISQAAGAVGKINVTGGTNTITDAVYVGIYGGTDGTLEISGGTNTFAKVAVGYSDADGAEGGSGILNLTGGTGTTITRLQVGVGTGTSGAVNVTGGTHKITAESYLGGNSGNNSLTISAGTLNGPGANFLIGDRRGNTRGTMTVKGTGTYSQTGGNFIVTAGKNAGDTNTVYLQDEGTMTLPWLSLGQNWEAHQGTAAVDVSGGTLTITNNFRIGFNDRGEATISGGNITVKNAILLDDGQKGSVLNVQGSGATIKTAALNLGATGTANFTAGAVTFTNGKPNAPLSTIAVTGTATVASNLNIDMTNYQFDSGIAFLDGTTTNLVTSGALTYAPASVNVTGPWLLNQNGNNLELKLDESKIALLNLSGDGVASGILGESGWIKMSGEGDTARIYVGDGQNMTQLVDWAEEHFAGDSGVKVSAEGSFLTLANLDLGADSIGYLAWNLGDYNQLYGTNVTFQNLPEPSAWALMLLGGMIFLFRRRRS